MSIINFSIPKSLDVRLKEAIKKKGFPSKAELFRYALIRYLDESSHYEIGSRSLDENPRITALSGEIEDLIVSRLKKKTGSGNT